MGITKLGLTLVKKAGLLFKRENTHIQKLKVSEELSDFIKKLNSPVKSSNITQNTQNNPYIEEFFGKNTELVTYDFNYIKKAMSGEIRYYTEDGLLFYKKTPPKKHTKIKKILNNLAEKLTKHRHKKFKRKLAEGKYNSTPIEFRKADNIEEAIKFAKENDFARIIIRINPNNESDLELLNTLNEALCKVHNRTGGKSIMPRIITIKDSLGTTDSYRATAAYTEHMDILKISREAKLRPFTVYHELGHANHNLNMDLSKLLRPTEMISRGDHNARVTIRFLKDGNLQNLINGNMRNYAATSPAEFVADVFAHHIEGKVLPKDIELAYDALKGPDIITRSIDYLS